MASTLLRIDYRVCMEVHDIMWNHDVDMCEYFNTLIDNAYKYQDQQKDHRGLIG